MTSLLAKDLKPCIFSSDIYMSAGKNVDDEFTGILSRILQGDYNFPYAENRGK